jgi:hypothetical protein
MALLISSSASTNKVNCGAGASFANLSAATYIVWARPTTLVQFARFMEKGKNIPATGYTTFANYGGGAAGRIAIQTYRAGGQLSALAEVANMPTVAANKWNCYGGTYDLASGVPHLYSGDLTTLMAEATAYVTQTNSSGAKVDDSTQNFAIGNSGDAAETPSYQGRIAYAAVFDRVLTLAEMRTWQFVPQVLSGCVGFWNLHGTGAQADLSGHLNTGTVSGATVADHVPLRGWNRRRSGLFVPYVVGGGTPPAVVIPRLLMLGVG